MTDINELEQIRSDLAAFDGRDDLSADEVTRATELLDKADRLAEAAEAARSFDARRVASQERLSSLLSVKPTAAESMNDVDEEAQERSRDIVRGRNPWDQDAIARNLHNADEITSRALDAAESTPGIGDSRRQALTDLIERGEGEVAQMVLATTSPAYKRAFGAWVRSGGDLSALDASERQAIAFAEPLRRAMAAGTNNAGGFLVPTDIEPSVTLSSAGTSNPIYSLARRVQTTGTTYRVVTAPHGAWSWDGENAEVSDDTPTFASVDIPLYVAQGFIPMSIASQQSIQGAMSIAQDVLMGGYTDLVGAALTTGSGSSQPTGVITALTGTGSEINAAGEAVALADAYGLFDALPQRHRRNATWMSNIAIMSDLRQLSDANGHQLINRLTDGSPDTLFGRPYVENPDMDGSINAAATANNYSLLIGDFQHFVVAEGIGTLVEVIPHVFGGNGRPIGARGLYMTTRFGSDSVLDDAFRMLDVATTA